MSDKVILTRDNRATQEVLLPRTGITIQLHSSLLLGDAGGIDMSKLNEGNLEEAVKMLVKLIKSWNAYGKEEDTEPLPINEATVGLINVGDLAVLTEVILGFQTAEKKS